METVGRGSRPKVTSNSSIQMLIKSAKTRHTQCPVGAFRHPNERPVDKLRKLWAHLNGFHVILMPATCTRGVHIFRAQSAPNALQDFWNPTQRMAERYKWKECVSPVNGSGSCKGMCPFSTCHHANRSLANLLTFDYLD